MGYVSRPVRDKDTGQVFDSIQKACKFYNLNQDVVYRRLRNNLPIEGANLEYVEGSPEEEAPADEEWRQIPGYEGLYSISNYKRIRCDKFENRYKKITTTKLNQQVVALYKNSLMDIRTVNSLYNLAWEGTPIPESRFKKSKEKKVRCVTDGKLFDSCKECAKFYHIEYNKFFKILNGTVEKPNLKFERVEEEQ